MQEFDDKKPNKNKKEYPPEKLKQKEKKKPVLDPKKDWNKLLFPRIEYD